MTAWSLDDPGHGDLDGIRLRSARLADRLEHATSVEMILRQAVGAMPDLWSGAGHDAWQSSAASAVSAWAAIGAWSDAERSALLRYVAAVESIAARAARHRSIIESGEHELTVLNDIASLLLDPPLVAVRIADQNDVVAASRAALAALALERQEADDDCVAAIRAARQEPTGRHRAQAPSAADLASLGDLGLLSTLGALDATGLGHLVASDPALADRLRAVDPTDIARWWVQLDAASRDALVAGLPAVIGNLEGVPYRDRDRANHVTLDREIARLSDASNISTADAERLLALTAVSKALGRGMEASPPRELVSLSLDGDPKAAVSVGDLDRAAYVSYIVPGMGTRVAGDMTRYTKAAAGLHDVEWRTGRIAPAEVAVVAWLDYDPPGPTDVIGVANDRLAQAGGHRFAAGLGGLAAVREVSGRPADVTVGAHSYGTDVVTYGLTENRADHVVLFGSAGIARSIPTASSLNVPKGEVFATQGAHDGWAPVGQIISGRLDPTSPAFGAHVFGSEAAADDHGLPLQGVTQHGPLVAGEGTESYSYLDDRTSAQFDFAKIAVGQGSTLTVAGTPDDRLGGMSSSPSGTQSSGGVR